MQFIESDLSFDFLDAAWTDVMQYDVEKDYVDKIQKELKGTKAIDFLGIFNKNTLVLMEVKNFRGHRIENKPRLENGDNPLEVEVALKIRDTLAGIVGAARNSTHKKEIWRKYFHFISNFEKRIECVLWLEEDLDSRPSHIVEKRKKAQGGTLTQQLKKRLTWFTPYVIVACIETPYKERLNLNVTFLETQT